MEMRLVWEDHRMKYEVEVAGLCHRILTVVALGNSELELSFRNMPVV